MAELTEEELNKAWLTKQAFIEGVMKRAMEYINEAEHQDGPAYWLTESTDYVEDFGRYLKSLETWSETTGKPNEIVDVVVTVSDVDLNDAGKPHSVTKVYRGEVLRNDVRRMLSNAASASVDGFYQMRDQS